ncbi:unnamed protein product, partial [Strongylus vulgaris]
MNPSYCWISRNFRKFPSSLRRFSHEAGATKVSKESNALKRFMIDKIRATGPITVAEYMKTAVSAPSVGYYGLFSDSQKVFGKEGDFITAPELTQLFGELLGVWCYYELANTGHRGHWQLVEFGPGTGQLMCDLLSVMERFQVTYSLFIPIYGLIKRKENYVRKNTTKSGVPIFWYKTIEDVPENFSVFIANEFLDALPVHQFARDGDGNWHELYVNINEGDELCFMNSKGENLHTRGLLPKEIREDKERKYWECSPEAGTFVNQVAERIVYNGGFGLLIDYGHDGSRNKLSFRAYKKHQLVDPLSQPGFIDLTADVDFGYLKSLVVDRVAVFGPNTQREFLAQLGAELRLRRLLKSCDDREKQEMLIRLFIATNRLESYNFLMGEMGERFMAMSMFPKTLNGILEKRG